jgi:hypothetical protein
MRRAVLFLHFLCKVVGDSESIERQDAFVFRLRGA